MPFMVASPVALVPLYIPLALSFNYIFQFACAMCILGGCLKPSVEGFSMFV